MGAFESTARLIAALEIETRRARFQGLIAPRLLLLLLDDEAGVGHAQRWRSGSNSVNKQPCYKREKKKSSILN